MKQRAGARRGSALVELAITFPVLSLVLMGTIDFARAFYTWLQVSGAARAGAIYGSRSSTSPDDSSGISTAATNAAANVTSLQVTANKVCGCSDGSTGSCGVISCSNKYTYTQVIVRKDFTALAYYPGVPSSIPISVQVMMRAK